MTREEAISILERVAHTESKWPGTDDTLEALGMAISALRQQEPNDWICTLKCTALMDEGMCSHGGLCCLYESQRTIKENQPLTLDELRKMDGEPVWIVAGDVSWWDIVSFSVQDWLYLAREEELRYSRYGEWLAYRQKPEEGTG